MLAIATAALAGAAACSTDSGGGSDVKSTPAPTASSGAGSSGTTSDGSSAGAASGSGTTSDSSSGGASGAGSPSIPTLINVNLQNVLNDLSVSLQVDRNSIPVTAQVPVDVAAAVCGVSVDALAASLASGNGKCTATTTSPQLNQVVQQQISTGGDVNGGDQTLNTGGA
jgi:hypothetical protein